jgi:hypothetical protein
MVFITPAPHTCRAYRSGNVSAASGAWSTIDLNAEDGDNPGWHDNVTNSSRITVDRDGTYLIHWGAAFSADATGIRCGRVLIGGVDAGLNSASVYQAATPSFTCNLGNSAVVTLSNGDYVELAVYQNSGGNLNVLGSAAYNSATFLQVTRLVM